jgi:hypothetical protein
MVFKHAEEMNNCRSIVTERKVPVLLENTKTGVTTGANSI